MAVKTWPSASDLQQAESTVKRQKIERLAEDVEGAEDVEEGSALGDRSIDIGDDDVVGRVPKEDARRTSRHARVGRSDGERDRVGTLLETECFLQV